MLTIEKTEVHGFITAIHGMRNPLESWDKKDSYQSIQDGKAREVIGPNDLALMKKLSAAGSDHGKFMRMITVTCDVTAPFYWWKEYDTYKVGTVANSCSTMHKIQAHPFDEDMFSVEHLLDWDDLTQTEAEAYEVAPMAVMRLNYDCLNTSRELYLKTGDKAYWWQMIQLLPTAFNQKRTVQLNYQVLKNIYHARNNHKLDEWHTFCDWIETLPESELITEKKKDPCVVREDLPEFIGQILDIFEDYLEEKGISVSNQDRDEAIADGEDPEGLCILYGTEYGNLQSSIEDLLINWGVVNPHTKKEQKNGQGSADQQERS